MSIFTGVTGMARRAFKRFEGSSVDEQATENDDDDMSFIFSDLTDPSTKTEGAKLFEQFVLSQLGSNTAMLPYFKMFLNPSAAVATSSPQVADAATRLCQLATSFAESDERKKVKDMANVMSADITSQDLATILTTMTSRAQHQEEGVVVFFYFCYDLAMRKLEGNFGDFKTVMDWCKAGIVGAMASRAQGSAEPTQ